jgi:ankyrin repeat protein
VDLLLDARADPNREFGYERMTPLMLAAKACKSGAVAKLRFAGARVDQRSNEGRTALIYGAECSDAGVVTDLLMHGNARPDAQDDQGRTALMQAAARGHQSTVDAILFWGKPKLDLRDHGGRSALQLARDGRHEEVAKKLETAGAR